MVIIESIERSVTDFVGMLDKFNHTRERNLSLGIGNKSVIPELATAQSK